MIDVIWTMERHLLLSHERKSLPKVLLTWLQFQTKRSFRSATKPIKFPPKTIAASHLDCVDVERKIGDRRSNAKGVACLATGHSSCRDRVLSFDVKEQEAKNKKINKLTRRSLVSFHYAKLRSLLFHLYLCSNEA